MPLRHPHALHNIFRPLWLDLLTQKLDDCRFLCGLLVFFPFPNKRPQSFTVGGKNAMNWVGGTAVRIFIDGSQS